MLGRGKFSSSGSKRMNYSLEGVSPIEMTPVQNGEAHVHRKWSVCSWLDLALVKKPKV